MMKENTLSGQVTQSRKDLQKGRSHLTPQGFIQSYGDDTANNKQ